MFTKAAVISITVTIVLGVSAIIAVVLRLYSRILQKIPFGGDDYCMVAALVLSTCINVMVNYSAATTEVGNPSYMPTPADLILLLKIVYASENCQIAAMGLVKVSMLLFYRRLFIMDWFLRWNMVLIAIVSSFTLAILLAMLFAKWPIKNEWNPEAGYDIDPVALVITFVSLNLVFDVITLAMPIVAVHSLRIAAQRKLIYIILFTLGSMCIVTSICRLVYVVKFVSIPPEINSLFEVPFIFDIFWAYVEPPLFIITGCLLTLGPIYRLVPSPVIILQSMRSMFLKLIGCCSSDTIPDSADHPAIKKNASPGTMEKERGGLRAPNGMVLTINAVS